MELHRHTPASEGRVIENKICAMTSDVNHDIVPSLIISMIYTDKMCIFNTQSKDRIDGNYKEFLILLSIAFI
jgi:hypothetical protein